MLAFARGSALCRRCASATHRSAHMSLHVVAQRAATALRHLHRRYGSAPPLPRCQARGEPVPTYTALEDYDQIQLNGLIFHGYHGIHPEERRFGQKFQVDATLYCNLFEAAIADDIERTVSYASVYDQIKAIVEGEPRKLVETVAQSVCDAVLRRNPGVLAVRIAITKPHVHVAGSVRSLGVQIIRVRPPLDQQQQ